MHERVVCSVHLVFCVLGVRRNVRDNIQGLMEDSANFQAMQTCHTHQIQRLIARCQPLESVCLCPEIMRSCDGTTQESYSNLPIVSLNECKVSMKVTCAGKMPVVL